MGKIFGYARVSMIDQNLDLQKDLLIKYGAQVIYEEKSSGKNKSRPELTALLKATSAGDTVVVYKLDRISRSTKHLLELTEYFEKKEIKFVSLVDSIDTSTSTGRFFFHIMASITELEREILIERTQAGLSAARSRGRVGGRPKTNKDRVERAIKLYKTNEYSLKEIKEMTGVSKSVLYRNLEQYRG